jgi:hypothetical protein
MWLRCHITSEARSRSALFVRQSWCTLALSSFSRLCSSRRPCRDVSELFSVKNSYLISCGCKKTLQFWNFTSTYIPNHCWVHWVLQWAHFPQTTICTPQCPIVLVSLLSWGTNQNTSLNKATYPMPEFILSCLTGCLAKKLTRRLIFLLQMAVQIASFRNPH